MIRLLLTRIGREILRGIREEIDDARETGEFPFLRSRIEWHEDKAAEWKARAQQREDRGYATSTNRKQRRAYFRALAAAKRNEGTARALSDLIDALSKGAK